MQEILVALQSWRILSAVSDMYTIILHTDTHTYLNPLNTTQKSDLPGEVAFLYIYILYLLLYAYSLPARRWDRAAEICAFFSPTMSYLNMGKMDSSASTPGKAV